MEKVSQEFQAANREERGASPNYPAPTRIKPAYSRDLAIAGGAIVLLLVHLSLRLVGVESSWPLYLAFVLGGIPLIFDLIKSVFKLEFGADLLAGISIVSSILIDELLAGVVVIVMLSSGKALEFYAMKRASSVLEAVARRVPTCARLVTSGQKVEIPLAKVAVGDLIEVWPHEISPVDGVVEQGFGTMDESYLTGEPYQMRKAPGSSVLSGAINGNNVLVIRATALAEDSRYQRIVKVISEQANKSVPMKRLGDLLGAWYTPVALFFAIWALIASGSSERFLSVLMVATPCPLLIGIPVAIIGAISLAAKNGIIIKDPAVLERVTSCRTIILDKTGTLTYGVPELVEVELIGDSKRAEILSDSAALEQYSKHPLASAVLQAADREKIKVAGVESLSEAPGEGLTGICSGRRVHITGRSNIESKWNLPPAKAGLECIVVRDGIPGAVLHFRDTPRQESRAFVAHLMPYHNVRKIMILSGDRNEEVRHLASQVGIKHVEGQLSPEEKLSRVIAERRIAPTLYVGDGINDAPSLQAATVGIALGASSDITSEAAGAVILEPSLEKVHCFLHLAARMRRIALQSALGGMALSVLGMAAAGAGLLSPLAAALTQEGIDVLAVLNALRAASFSGTGNRELSVVVSPGLTPPDPRSS